MAENKAIGLEAAGWPQNKWHRSIGSDPAVEECLLGRLLEARFPALNNYQKSNVAMGVFWHIARLIKQSAKPKRPGQMAGGLAGERKR